MLWRCQNRECGIDTGGMPSFEFESDLPVCPKCGIDKRRPEYRNSIVALVTIHFHMPDKRGPDIGTGSRYRIGCGGSMSGKRATGDATQVNCPECKKTVEYRNSLPDEVCVLQEYDKEIQVDLQTKQVTFVEPESAPKNTEVKVATKP